MFFIIFSAELIFLFIASRFIVKMFSSFLLRFTKSKKITIWILSLLFLPGTFIHELSHYVSALSLFVNVGKFNLTPRIEVEHVTLGSVHIEKTDPIRRFLIGASPFLFGMIIICAVPFYIFRNENSIFPPDNVFKISIIIFTSYFLFTVANSMFSSKKDMEGSLVLLIFLAVIAVGLRFAGIEFEAVLISLVLENENVFKNLSILLLPSVIIDFMIVALGSRVKE